MINSEDIWRSGGRRAQPGASYSIRLLGRGQAANMFTLFSFYKPNMFAHLRDEQAGKRNNTRQR